MNNREPTPGPVEITLPWPPSVNNLYVTKGVLSMEGREYKHKVLAALSASGLADLTFGNQYLAVKIDQYPPNDASDWDNPIKALCDALEWCGVLVNDNNIKKCDGIDVHPKGEESCVIVRLRAIIWYGKRVSPKGRPRHHAKAISGTGNKKSLRPFQKKARRRSSR